MTQEGMTEELRRFVLTSVPSVPFVEALLIFREVAGPPVTIDFLAKRLYIAEKQAAEIVEQLRTARIVVQADGAAGHRYAPAPELVPHLDLLASVYRTNLVEITSLIHSRTGRLAQQFADAFRLRKD